MIRLLLCRQLMGSFKGLSESLRTIQEVSSRDSKTQIFSEYLNTLSQDQRNTLRDLFQLSFQKFSRIDDRVLKNHCELLSIQQSSLQALLDLENDISKAVCRLHPSTNNTPHRLDIQQVYLSFLKIRDTEGKASTARKFQILDNLLSLSENQHQKKILLSLLTSNLKIGFNEISIIKAFEKLNPRQKSTQEQKHNCMLTKPLKNFQEAIKFINNHEIGVEYKFDGERTHLQYIKGQSIELFSRSGKSQLEKYSDLVNLIKNQLQQIEELESCILDGEIVSVDSENKMTNIQILLNRKSRGGSEGSYFEKVMVFDILEKNGESLLGSPYQERIQKIPSFSSNKVLTNVERSFFRFPQDFDRFKLFFQEAVRIGYEGLILKKVGSKYSADKSRVDWAKLKKGDDQSGTSGRSVDVDLIMMGAYRGKGKRLGVLGSFLFGTLHNGKIYPITKTGTSLTNAKFEEVTQLVSQYSTKEIPAEYVIPKGMDIPDVWIEAHFVVEISSQEWSRSPIYPFNSNEQGGLSLRFPKFIRIRDDKGILDSTLGEQILEQIQ